jgi:hypothetical protein
MWLAFPCVLLLSRSHVWHISIIYHLPIFYVRCMVAM